MIIRSLTLLTVLLCAVLTTSAQLSVVTFVHSSPEPSLRVIDLYITQAGVITKVDDIAFQKGSNLEGVAIFGDIEVTMSVAPSSSVGISESVFETTFTPMADKGYMAVFTGVRKVSDYVANPEKKSIELAITTYEVPNENSDPNKTAVYFFHGATDLEVGDIWPRGAAKAAATNVGFMGRTPAAVVLDRKSTVIDFTKVGDKSKVLASFNVDLAGLGSNILVCVVSGFKTPNDNAKSTDTLALLNVLEDGRIVRSPLIAGSQKSRVQVVHASADPAFGVVDLWLNGVKTFDNVAFRKASAFVDAPANTPLVIGLAPATSTAYKDTIATITLEPLRPQRTYTIVALGVSDTSKFAKNPDGVAPGFRLLVLDGALEKNGTTKTGVRTLHAVTDAPTVSFASSKVSYASKLSYGSATPAYIETEPATDTVWMNDGDGKKLKGFLCDFRGAARATMMIATGFADPSKNGGGPALAVILVDPNGTVNSNIQAIDPPGETSVDDDVIVTGATRLHPNPSSDVAEIFIPVTETPFAPSFSIVDVRGVEVRSGTLLPASGGFVAGISVDSLPVGSYQVVIRTISGRILATSSLVIGR